MIKCPSGVCMGPVWEKTLVFLQYQLFNRIRLKLTVNLRGFPVILKWVSNKIGIKTIEVETHNYTLPNLCYKETTISLILKFFTKKSLTSGNFIIRHLSRRSWLSKTTWKKKKNAWLSLIQQWNLKTFYSDFPEGFFVKARKAQIELKLCCYSKFLPIICFVL